MPSDIDTLTTKVDAVSCQWRSPPMMYTYQTSSLWLRLLIASLAMLLLLAGLTAGK